MNLLERLPGSGRLRRVAPRRPDVELLRTRLLSESDLFRGVPADELHVIAGKLPMATCRRGQLIYAPGETGEALFVLKAGHVRLYRLTPDGRKLVLATAGPGTVFGEMAAIGQSMHDSYAEALEDCVLCIMSSVDFEAMVLEHPAVGLQVIRLLSRRLLEAEQRLEQFAFAPLSSRLASTLLRLAEGNVVRGYSHQELAEMLATSRETVTRALLELKAAGVVEIGRRSIELLDRGVLERMSRDSHAGAEPPAGQL